MTRLYHARRRPSGFTLIELLVVLAIISMLLSVAVPRYFKSLDKARDTLLADNLRQTRSVLDAFYGDMGRYPLTLDELVDRKYLKDLPYDPVLGSSTQWVVVPPREGVRGGVYNLKSAAPGAGLDGRPYAEW